ncbi:aldo/keto reductase [Proteiniphilum sp. X52]|nr:aldo/keto reductase [Proteiniphilum sp. X52]
MPYGIGINSEKDMLSEDKAVELLQIASDSGINFFDTARMYGNSERIMGKAFKDRRRKVVIASKCVPLLDKKGKLPPQKDIKGIIEKSLTESLEALQTDYIDIYMLHQATMEILDSDEILNAFSDFKNQGIFKAAGVSSYTNEVSKKVIDSGFWNMIQLPFNLMDQRQGDLFEDAQKKGVGIVVRSVLLKGLLSDRGKNLHHALKDVENHIAKYHVLLEGTNYKLPALATKFALSFPEVSSVLVGIDRQEYLEEALRTVDGVYLSKEKLDQARQLAYPEPDFINLPYWDKMKWLT